jgi:nucleoside-diphosphate-sugar epimerase
MILVTGGTGLVGSHLLFLLCKEGETPRAIYRTEKSIEKCKALFSHRQEQALFRQIEWVQADILDYFALEAAFTGISHVYHCAALVSFGPADRKQLMEVNITGTTHVVNLCLEKKIQKLAYVSSVASLGGYENGKCTDEEAPWQKIPSTTDYSVSKYYAENEVWRGQAEGLNTVTVNPATILGYGKGEGSLAIIEKVRKGLPGYPAGSNGFVGAEDVALALYALMNSDITGERFVLVAENLSFKELFEKIARQLGVKPPKRAIPKSLARFAARLNALLAAVGLSNAPVLPSHVHKAYAHRCYSAEKIKAALGYEFEALDEVLSEVE